MAAYGLSILQQVDAQLEHLFTDWNVYTTLILIALFTYLISPIFFYIEPDIHPFLLARQSSASRVRQPGESATYRSLETPHGYPLKSGLNVKDPGQPKWTAGRNGSLRDVWKRAVSGPVDGDGKPTGEASKVFAVLGREEVMEYDFKTLSVEINAVGKHLRRHHGTRVAIYLSNSVEFLVALFACIFYGLTPILIPQEQPLENLAKLLKDTKADSILVGAGVVPLDELLEQYPDLKQVIWVVARDSRHLDWNEVPEGEGGKADIAVWHEIIDESESPLSELPMDLLDNNLPNVVILSKIGSSGVWDIVELTQKNLIAAIGAQLSILPRQHRLSPVDTLLPLASLTESYPLIITLSALFSNTSLALNSVSGPKASYAESSRGVSPTILIADPQTLSTFCAEKEKALFSSTLSKFTHSRKLQTLAAGNMVKASSAVTYKPRLIYTYTYAIRRSFTPSQLSNLRIFTGAHIIYAFIDPSVAGAVTQTHMLDYASHGCSACSHVGPPLSCVEIKLKEYHENPMGTDEEPIGGLIVSGPAVVRGEEMAEGRPLMAMTASNTLAYPS